MVDTTENDVRVPLLAELVKRNLHTVDGRASARPHLRLTDISDKLVVGFCKSVGTYTAAEYLLLACMNLRY